MRSSVGAEGSRTVTTAMMVLARLVVTAAMTAMVAVATSVKVAAETVMTVALFASALAVTVADGAVEVVWRCRRLLWVRRRRLRRACGV